MKKLLLIFSLLILVSGCSLVDIEKQSYQETVNSILAKEKKLKNVSLEGYSYYLPKGVMLKSTNSTNSILYYNHKKMYLYVDVVSYLHKEKSNYESDSSNYLSMEIKKDQKEGYLEITEIDNQYFIEFMFHYAKIEAYVNLEDIKQALTVMAYILNNVEYNDVVLNTLIGEESLTYNEESFNIFKPKRENGSFLEYEELYQFDTSDKKTDEDNIDLEKYVE